MDLSGVLNNATNDFIAIAGFLITALVGFWAIKFGMGLLDTDSKGSPPTSTYSSGHLNDPDYMGWLGSQEGKSNDIRNQRDRYDEPYQDYLDRNR